MRDQHDTCTLGAAGGDEVAVVPWPMLLRQRVGGARRRVHGSDHFRWWVLWSVLFGLFSVNIVFTLFAVAQDRIARDLGTTTDGLTWAITLPLLAFGVAAPTAGKLGDLFGHRRVYLVGMAGSFVAAALTAVVPNVGCLIVVRTLGQLLGAATGAASMALIFSVFDRDDRVKAMGWWSLVGAGGPVVGVVIGGPVIESVGWRWMFWAQVPLTAVAGVIAVVVLPGFNGEHPDERPRFDVAGTAALTVAVTALLLTISRGPAWGWASPAILTATALVVAGLAAFWAAERRALEPLLPLAWLRRRNFTLGIAAQALGMFAYMGGFILAPRLLGSVFGFGETKIGLVSIARPLTFGVLAPIAGYLAVRVGERVSAVAGGLALVGSMLSFASLTGASPLLAVLGCLALSGAGMGVASPSLAASIANAIEEESLGVASAAQQLMTQVGLVAGIQLMSSVQSAGAGGGLVPSFATAYRLGAGVALLGALASAFVVSSARRPADDTAVDAGELATAA